MLSKEQAQSAAEALLSPRRRERDRRSPVLAQIPELSCWAYAYRKDVLRRAKRNAWRSWPMLAVTCVVLAFSALWLWALFVVRAAEAEAVWWLPFVAAGAMRMMLHRQVRRELRRVLEFHAEKNQ